VSGLRRIIGRAGVAVIFPGDEHDLTAVGGDAAKYYRFVYRSKRGADSTRAKKVGGSFIVDWNDVVLQPTSTGGVRRIFDRGTAMLERFEMHASMLNQGLTNHAAHTHGAEESVVMLRGDVRMLIGTEHQGASAGDIIFLASNIPHSLDNTGKGVAEYFAFQWQ
jgi:(S)-ureidoglycine aminohydrolase